MVHLAIDTLFRSSKEYPASYEEVEYLCDRRSDRTSSSHEAEFVLNWKEDQYDNINFDQSFLCQDKVELSSACKYAIYVYMTEIYNDKVYDLLDTQYFGKRTTVSLKTNPYTKEIYPANVRKIYVSTVGEAIQVINKGLKMRASHSTGCNETSSRSHAIITLEVKRIITPMNEVFVSKLTIADLAGNERNKLSKTEGSRFQESCAINKSLMLLGQCLQMQKGEDSKKSPVNESSIFRSSKLNQLLLANAFRLEVQQKSVMLVAMDPYGDLNSAAQVLRYSATAREIPESKIENNYNGMMGNPNMNYNGYYGYSQNNNAHNGNFYPGHSRNNSRDALMSDTRAKPQSPSRASSTSSDVSVHSSLTLNVDQEENQSNAIRDLLRMTAEAGPDKAEGAQSLLLYINELESKVADLNQKCLDMEWEVRAELAEEHEKAVEEATVYQLNNRGREEVNAQRLANAKIDILRRTVYEPQIDELTQHCANMEQRCEVLEHENNECHRQNEALQEIIRRSGLLQQLQNISVSGSGNQFGNMTGFGDIPSNETGYLIQLLQTSGL